MKMSTVFENALTSLTLRPWPRRHSETLQAWDGADRLLLEHLATAAVDAAHILLINDTCGAIALSLLKKGHRVTVSGDSWLAYRALLENAANNDVCLDQFQWLWPQEPVPPDVDLCLLRAPANPSLLWYQLDTIATSLRADTPVTTALMDKHTPASFAERVIQTLESSIRSRGQFKAHLYHGRIKAGQQRDRHLHGGTNYEVPGLPHPITVLPGVFAQRQLDIGTRLLLDYLPEQISGNVVDLGCGAGVLGLVAARRCRQASIWFADESAQALASCRHNVASLYPARRFKFIQGNGLDGVDEKFDYVLLNPPFHRGRAVDVSVGQELVRQSAARLNSGGELRMVVNRHLDYRRELKSGFSRVNVIASNPKFVVFAAIR